MIRPLNQVICRALGGILAAGLFPCFPVHAAELRILSVDPLPNQKLRLTFENTGLDLLNYVPSSLDRLGDGGGNSLNAGARILEVGPGVFQTTIPTPSAPFSFHRIAGFSVPDTDGDGLSDELEILVGTSTSTFDTDGDRFGDAYELLNGSDPLVGGSVPDVVKVNFVETQSFAREGDGTITLALALSRNFIGPVRYSVAAMSTAVGGVDYTALNGVVNVTGASAFLSIPLIDDWGIEDVKLLVIDLENDPDYAYQTGGATRHTVLLYDNDTIWSAVMRNESSEQGARLRMLRQGSTTAAALVSSSDPNGPLGIQGVGSIPPGVWPMLSATLTSNTFHAVSAPIPAGTSALFGSATVNRTISFSAVPDATGSNPGTNYLFRTNMIIGRFTDRIEPEQVGLEYLTRETTGLVVLVEDLPHLPFPDLPAVATGPAPALLRANREESE